MTAPKFEITVNGERRPLDGVATVADLVAALDLDPRLVAVEHNGSIVARPAYGETPVTGGDRLEIVRFVQGG